MRTRLRQAVDIVAVGTLVLVATAAGPAATYATETTTAEVIGRTLDTGICPTTEFIDQLTAHRQQAATDPTAKAALEAVFAEVMADPARAVTFTAGWQAVVAGDLGNPVAQRLIEYMNCFGMAASASSATSALFQRLNSTIMTAGGALNITAVRPLQAALLTAPELLRLMRVSGVADDPAALPVDERAEDAGEVSDAVGASLDPVVDVAPEVPTGLLTSPREEHKRIHLRYYAVNAFGSELWSTQNIIDWIHNTSKKFVVEGDTYYEYRINSLDPLGLVGGWKMTGFIYDEVGRFRVGTMRNAGYQSRKKAVFELCINFLYFFEGCIDRSEAQNNLYGFWDGTYYKSYGKIDYFHRCDSCAEDGGGEIRELLGLEQG